MELKNKFDIGEEVFTIIQESLKVECPICKSSGIIMYNDYKIICPECKGKKEIFTNHRVWKVLDKKVTVRRIKASVGLESQTIKYLLSGSCDVNSRSENHLFKTKDDAESLCKEYNKIK